MGSQIDFAKARIHHDGPISCCRASGIDTGASSDGHAADDPNRAVGPEGDGSIVASSNQTLTPAGRIVNLGSPVRAKAIALNPNKKTNSAAVLLMGSAQPVIVLNTTTGQVSQRLIPTTVNGTAFTSSKAGFVTGIAYTADGRPPIRARSGYWCPAHFSGPPRPIATTTISRISTTCHFRPRLALTYKGACNRNSLHS